MNALSWATRLFAAIDRKDAEAFAAAFAEDGTFQFANAPATVGRASVLAAVTGFFGSIASLQHALTDVWEVPGAVVVVGRVTYTRLDGSRLDVPFADVLRLRDDRVTSWQIYIDASQLYQAA